MKFDRERFYYCAGVLERHIQFWGSPLIHTPKTRFDILSCRMSPLGSKVSVLEWFNYYALCEDEMAKKKQWSVEFVNITMDKAEKEKFSKWFANAGDGITKMVAQLIEADNRVSLSYNPETKSFICSVTGKEDSLNPNKCITSHGSTWFQALAVATYKIVILLENGVWEGDQETDTFG